MNELVTRTWNDTPISRRASDGYVNATAMCKAEERRWNDYVRLDRTQEYIAALTETLCGAAVAGNPATGISMIKTIQGGTPELQGTWIHPRLAVDLARWISPAFAVWMDGWFLEGAEPTATNRLDEIERVFNLLSKIGPIRPAHRDILQDLVMDTLTPNTATNESEPTGYQVTVTEAWRNVTGRKLAQNESSSIGRKIANTWRKEFGTEPPTAKTVVDGVARDVCRYDQKWLESKIRGMGQGNRIVGIVKKGVGL